MDPIQSWLDAKEVRRMAESLMAPAPEVDQAALEAGYGDDFEGYAENRAPEQPGTRQTAAPALPEHGPGNSPEGGAAGTSARLAVSQALADAKRLAEGSGMLSPAEAGGEGREDAGEVEAADAAPNPATQGENQAAPAAVGDGLVGAPVSSPFQLSEDQSPDGDLPVARQVAPPPERPPGVAPQKTALPSGQPVAAAVTGGARGPFLTRLQKFSGLLRERTGAKAMFLIDSEGQILVDEVGNSKLVQVARTLANASHAANRQTEGAAAVGNLHVKIGASSTLEVIPCRSRYGLLILGVVCPAPMGAERVKQVADYLSKTVEPTGNA